MLHHQVGSVLISKTNLVITGHARIIEDQQLHEPTSWTVRDRRLPTLSSKLHVPCADAAEEVCGESYLGLVLRKSLDAYPMKI